MDYTIGFPKAGPSATVNHVCVLASGLESAWNLGVDLDFGRVMLGPLLVTHGAVDFLKFVEDVGILFAFASPFLLQGKLHFERFG